MFGFMFTHKASSLCSGLVPPSKLHPRLTGLERAPEAVVGASAEAGFAVRYELVGVIDEPLVAHEVGMGTPAVEQPVCRRVRP